MLEVYSRCKECHKNRGLHLGCAFPPVASSNIIGFLDKNARLGRTIAIWGRHVQVSAKRLIPYQGKFEIRVKSVDVLVMVWLYDSVIHPNTHMHILCDPPFQGSIQ